MAELGCATLGLELSSATHVRVSYLFNLYKTPLTPFGFPTPIVPRLSGGVCWGGVIMGKNKFALKCSSGKIKCFKTMLFFFLMENRGIEDPPSQLNGKFH